MGQVKTVVTKHGHLVTTEQFNRSGNLTQVVIQSAPEQDAARIVYAHDAQGRVQEERAYEADGSLISKTLYSHGYDQQGNRTAIVAAREDGSFAHATLIVYDARGNVDQEFLFTGHGVIDKTIYDVRGNAVYTARYLNGRVMFESINSYSMRGRLRESRFYSADGELVRKVIYTYDDAGKRMEEASELYRSGHLKKVLVAFDLDEAGNWITETTTRWVQRNGTLIQEENGVTRQRTITYY